MARKPSFGNYKCMNRYSKTFLKRPLKIDKTKVLMANGSLMEVKSIAECSPLDAECSPIRAAIVLTCIKR